jgi:uncharacterized damage-inducible protein DinB
MDDRLARIGRLAAVARGLEREGAYNGAKLLRAAMESELVRYAEASAPSGAAATADALVGMLAVDGTALPAGLASLLGGIEELARAGGTVPLTVAPRVHVCRFCGEVFLGEEVPSACPSCEAPALSYHEVLPVWYLEHTEPGTVLAALAAGPRHVADALAGHSDDDLARRPARGEWSARETLEHLLFAEQLFAERVERLLAEDDPDLAARAVWSETPASDEGTLVTGDPASALAVQLRGLRSATLARLAALPEAAWSRAGMHPEWGRVTVLSQAGYFARHEASHMAQLVAAADGRVPRRA